jgi:hypothetical protein
MNEIIVPRRKRGGLTVVSDALAPYESVFAVARRCANLRPSLPAVRDLETARIVRAKLLPCCDQIYFASRALADMTSDNPGSGSPGRAQRKCSATCSPCSGGTIRALTRPVG